MFLSSFPYFSWRKVIISDSVKQNLSEKVHVCICNSLRLSSLLENLPLGKTTAFSGLASGQPKGEKKKKKPPMHELFDIP